MSNYQQQFIDKGYRPIKPIKIAIDFDGTIVKHEYPKIGDPVPLAIETLKLLQDVGHELYLWTVRDGVEFEEAVKYLKANGLNFKGFNQDETQFAWNKSRKLYCALYIDDAAFGCPLLQDQDGHDEDGIGIAKGRPYADWDKIQRQLINKCLLF